MGLGVNQGMRAYRAGTTVENTISISETASRKLYRVDRAHLPDRPSQLRFGCPSYLPRPVAMRCVTLLKILCSFPPLAGSLRQPIDLMRCIRGILAASSARSSNRRVLDCLQVSFGLETLLRLRPMLISRWPLDVINHNEFNGALRGFQFQTKLLLNCSKQRCATSWIGRR
jgi:hypothetical protein